MQGNHYINLKNSIFVAFVLLLVLQAQTQISPNISSGIPFLQSTSGYIPLYYNGNVARDLNYQGKELSADEAVALWKKGVIKDLSDLEPSFETYDPDLGILKNESYTGALRKGSKLKVHSKDLAPGGRLEFLSLHSSAYGSVRISARNEEAKIIKISIGPRAKNAVLVTQLLYKLGYKSVDTAYADEISLVFTDLLSKQRFLVKLSERFSILFSKEDLSESEKSDLIKSIAGFDSYFTDSMFDKTNVLTIKASVLFENESERYNLTDPILPSDIKNRRKYSSLVLPLCLFDIPESLNLFSYKLGNQIDEKLFLNCLYANNYSTSFEDAKWIAKRILSLEESDFEQILSSLPTPYCANELLFELIKSRRNSLIEHFQLESEFSAFDLNLQLNCNEEVINGVQVKAKYEGDPNLYAHDRFEGPLVFSEIWSMFKSIAFSNLLGYLTDQVNSKMGNTNISEQVYRHKIDLAARQFAEFIKYGKVSKVPFGSYPVDYKNFGLIYSRDIVAGNYLGTNNMVQLVDNFGFRFNFGRFFGFDALKSYEQLNSMFDFGLQLAISHIQPIQIEQAKIIGREDDSKGAIELALKKQSSKLLKVFTYPFTMVSKEKPLENFRFQLKDSFDLDLLIFSAFLESKQSPLLHTWYSITQVADSEVLETQSYKEMSSLFFKSLKSLWNEQNCASSKCELFSDQVFDFYVDRISSMKEKLRKEDGSLEVEIEEKLNSLQRSLGTKERKKINPLLIQGKLLQSIGEFPVRLRAEKNLSTEQRVKDFKENFSVGDSLIVNLGFNASARLNAGHVLTSHSSWYLDTNYERTVVYRTHIQRVDNNRIQIYRSIANQDLFSYITGLQAYFRLFAMGQSLSLADVGTRMYTIQLEAINDEDKDAEYFAYSNDLRIHEKLNAIRDLIFTGSLEGIKKFSVPVRAQHNISEKGNHFNFLFLKLESYELFDEMSVKNEEQESVKVLRYSKGQRAGYDFQSLIANWLTSYLRVKQNSDLKVRIASNSDPGKTILGSSRSTEASYEAVLPEEDIGLDQSCIRIQKKWNQFLASRESVIDEIRSLKKKYGFSLIEIPNTDRVLGFEFLSFNTSLNLFQKGIEHLESISEEEYKRILERKIVYPSLRAGVLEPKVGSSRARDERLLDQEKLEQRIDLSFLWKFHRLKKARNHEDKMRSVVDLLIHAEKYLKYEAFVDLVGGQNNLFIAWRIDAYREGDESVSPSVFQNTRGRIPAVDQCPISNIVQQTGYSESEFSLQWLFQRY